MFYPREKNWRLNRGKLSSRAPQGIWLGNSIPEYAVIALFLIFISLAGIQLLSANLNTAMAKVRDDMETHQQAAQTVLVAEQAAAAAAASGASGSGAGLTAAQTALLQQSLVDKIQTTGANGATELLANQLGAAAALLLTQGKITTSQYDILMQLANQGHKIAEIEGLLSQALKASNGDRNTFTNMTVVFEGKTYTAKQLAAMIGVNNNRPTDFAAADILSIATHTPTSNVDQTANPVLGSFLNLYNQALASGALSDPSALATVNSASTQIASLSEAVEDSTTSFSIGEFDGTGVKDLNTVEAEAVTNMNSSQICITGSFQDNGVLCSP